MGYAGVDNIGLAGVEQFFDGSLRNGDPVTLSIDVRLQRAMRQELQATMEKFSAIGAAGIVMDVRTGEILSMVSLPGFDPNTPKTIDETSLFNRATLGVYEMGSTFKIFNTAMSLDSGKVTMASSFDATAPIKIGGFTINDDHAQNRWLTVPELFKFSSNIASAKMALQVGIETQQAFFDKIGFLKAVKLELPESAAPLYPSTWRPINAMTIAYRPRHGGHAGASGDGRGWRGQQWRAAQADLAAQSRGRAARRQADHRPSCRAQHALSDAAGGGRGHRQEGRRARLSASAARPAPRKKSAPMAATGRRRCSRLSSALSR